MKKTVLVTGATGGIGVELCKEFAKDNYDIVIVGRTNDKINYLIRILEQYPIQIYILKYDLRQNDVHHDILKEIKELKIQIDILINMAGFGIYDEFLNHNLEDQNNLILVNLNSLMNLCYIIGKEMKERNSGYIINFSSISAFFPGTYMATYYASKAFILSFSLALARELKPYNIAVLGICPGVIQTSFYDTAGADKSHSYLLDRMKPITAQKFAKLAYKQIKKRKCNYCIIGFKNKFLIFLSRFIPIRFLSLIIKIVQKPKLKSES
ncbi:MAG: SDR family oxidoreductase [Anaeroplasmataceae bacterium]|nr:SDR family oxidoreductase [Anaeroplasmataceae bacterium]